MADVNISKFRTSVNRLGSAPASPGFAVSEGQDPVHPSGSSNFVTYSGATDNVDLGEFGLEAGFITLDTTPTNTPTAQGTMFWDADDETVDIILNGYTMKIGEDLFYPVKNQTGSTIAKGTAVRFNGTLGASGRLLIAPFIANGSVPSSRFMGVTAEEILNGEDGKVLYFGRIRGINTNAFNEGDILYASTTVAGGFQTAIPVAPNNIVQVAAVVTKSINQGTIFVRPTLGSSINKDEGVKITSVANLDLLQYQSGTALWENKTLAQVIGSAYVPSTRTLTINGTTQDLSADRTFNVGTVTSVGLSSATSGVTIGSTPVTTSGTITLAIATASGSQNGLLSSTDWTTFNNKQNALTNPVTGTGTTNYLPKFTGSTTIGNSALQEIGGSLGLSVTPQTWWSSRRALEIFAGGAFAGVNAGWMEVWGNGYLDVSATSRYLQNGVAALYQIGNLSGNSHQWFTAPSGTAGNAISFTQAMTLTSGGNLLVGTTTDTGERLQVNGSGLFSSTVKINTSGVNTSLNAVSSGLQLVVDGSTGSNRNITFNIASTEAMRIDNNRNVGLGVTPSAWSLSGLSTMQIQNAGFFGYFNETGITQNAYFNSGWKYIATGNATEYLQVSGEHRWYNAPSGTAGNAISFTQAMTLTSGANLLVGGTTDNGARLQVSGRAYINNVGGSVAGTTIYGNDQANVRFRLENVSGRTWELTGGLTGANNSDFTIYDVTAAATRMVINSSGNVGIGTTSPDSRLQVNNPTASSTTDALIIQNSGVSAIGHTTGLRFRYNTSEPAAIRAILMSTSTGEGDLSFFTSPNGTGASLTERMRITSSGNVLIGTTTDNGSRLQVSGGNFRIQGVNANSRTIFYQDYSNSAVGMQMFNNSGVAVVDLNGNNGGATLASLGTGIVYSNAGTLTSTNPSDFNLKENIAPINYGLGEILKLNPVTFNWKNDTINQGKQYGFIAQEVQKIMPDLVKKGEYLGLDKEAIFTTLVKAIQEQQEIINDLKQRIK